MIVFLHIIIGVVYLLGAMGCIAAMSFYNQTRVTPGDCVIGFMCWPLVVVVMFWDACSIHDEQEVTAGGKR